MIFNYGPHGSGSSSGIDFGRNFDPTINLKFSFSVIENDKTVNYEDALLEIAEQKNICSFIKNNNNWDLKILKNCNIKFLKDTKEITVFMVGGGGRGSGADASTNATGNEWRYGTGGNGGFGGYTKKEEYNFLKNNSYEYIIGAGGTASSANGGNSKILLNNIVIFDVNGGESGTTGIRVDSSYNYGKKGNGGYDSSSEGTRDPTPGDPGYFYHSQCYGGGGGGGSVPEVLTANANYYIHNGISADGGEGGGGRGAQFNIKGQGSHAAGSGEVNTGGGGGGGCITSGDWYPAADGGSGIIILSNYDD